MKPLAAFFIAALFVSGLAWAESNTDDQAQSENADAKEDPHGDPIDWRKGPDGEMWPVYEAQGGSMGSTDNGDGVEGGSDNQGNSTRSTNVTGH